MEQQDVWKERVLDKTPTTSVFKGQTFHSSGGAETVGGFTLCFSCTFSLFLHVFVFILCDFLN